MDQRIERLVRFLNESHSGYHAIAALEREVSSAGYTRLYEGDDWNLQPGGKYYLIRGGTSLMAFRIPAGTPSGFLLSASHSDRPTFKFKENGELTGTYTRLAVERYGGILISTWLDRPLSLAGRVMVETETGVRSQLLDIDRDLLLIPNVAIHLNRQVNDGYKWNPAVDTLPLMGGKDAAGKLMPLLEQTAGGKILGHDLYLYVRQNARVWGIEEEYLSSAALDDLECAWCCTQGFLNADESESVSVLCVFDSEEVGSGSVQGAASTMLSDLLERICLARSWNYRQMISNSFMVSADNGHALHPNHPELSDPANAPILGKGLVLKFNATLKYCTDGATASIFRKICQRAGVDVQTYCNRADLVGGSTLGNISQTQVSIPTVDIGLPQLAMHSCYETGAVSDAISLMNAMTAYYGASLEVHGEAYILK